VRKIARAVAHAAPPHRAILHTLQIEWLFDDSSALPGTKHNGFAFYQHMINIKQGQ
jgi:hypothetical protein